MKCIVCKNKNIKFLNFFVKIPRSHYLKKKKQQKNIILILINVKIVQ